MVLYPVPVTAMCIQIFVYGVALLNLSVTISILVIFLFLQVERSRRLKERELELTNLRISVMLSQIQPHFLFNSLTTIKGLCSSDPSRAETAIDRFSCFLRGNMDSLSSDSLIPFCQEQAHTQSYVELEQLRFGERLRFRWEIPVSGFSLPPLTLQPLVENAVRHGITRREKGGTITIRTAETPDNWIITVQDDGIGFSPGTPESDSHGHIGLENVRRRLEAQCGGTLTVTGRPGHGTTAAITLPKEEPL